jgi:TetR/AcrR family transcriptional regulator
MIRPTVSYLRKVTPPEEEVRGRIVASALEIFSEKGFAAASLREIAENARTTKPMIYYYFESKDGLYVSLLRTLLQDYTQAVERAIDANSDALQQLESFANAYLDYFLSHEPHIAFILREIFGLGGRTMQQFGRDLDELIRGRLRQIIEGGIAAGRFAECDAEACSIAILGVLSMFVLRSVFGHAAVKRERALSQVMDYYVAGLRPGA